MKLRIGSDRKHGTAVRAALIGIATYVVLLSLVFAGISPETYDIQVGMPAPVAVYATKDIVDNVTTAALQEEAAAKIENSYRSVDENTVGSVLSDMEEDFSRLLELRSLYSYEQVSALTDDELDEINATLPVAVDAEQLKLIINASDEELSSVFSDASSLVESTLNATLPEGQESAAVTEIARQLADSDYDTGLVSIAVEVVKACIRPNMLIDEELTEANRQAARDAVEQEFYIKNETIVQRGEIVTEAQYEVIKSLGLINDNSYDMALLLGVAILVFVLVAAMALYLYTFEYEILCDSQTMILLSITMVLVIAISLIVREVNAYLMPVSLGLLLIAVLVKPSLAMFTNFIIAVPVSFLAGSSSEGFSIAMFSMMLMSVVSSPIVVIVMRKRGQRSATLLTGLLIGVVNFITTMAVGLISSSDIKSVLGYSAWATGSGLLGAVLCIGVQPLLEWMFNLTSPAKLLELSNPNQPLLRRLLLEAPGTYHHSIIVANLAEAAATAVGGNGLLARVGAYYHDVGKLKRPSYFKENQIGDNPHERTDPRVSTAILTAHTRDGVQLAQKARLPEAVIDIIRQHHGDSPVLYFYDKAVKLYGPDVDIAAFRYDGPRPRSKEAAIVMLADTIEAAARSMGNPDAEQLDALIRKLARNKLTDGQLDDSELTFRDLDVICGAFFTVLGGVFHNRIEYPDVSIPPRVAPELAEAEASGKNSGDSESEDGAVKGAEASEKDEGQKSEGNG